MAELRRMASDVRSEFESGLSLDDEPEPPAPDSSDRWVAENPSASTPEEEAVAPEAGSAPPQVDTSTADEED
jgi:hypothetical protein